MNPGFVAESWGRLRSRSEPAERGALAYAAGRSYGDCALNTNGPLLPILPGRLLHLDDAGVATVEPGLAFRDLLAETLPRGWLPPVIPGTGFATMGGAFANDVHGKNHEQAGSFGQHVTELDLDLPSGETRTLRPGEDLFRATAGGIGLTGTIRRLRLALQRVPGPSVRVTETRVASLDPFLDALAAAENAPYSVGWIDAAAPGSGFGRGILETAEPADAPVAAATARALAVPFDFPRQALNPLTVRLFNAAYWRRVPRAGRTRLLPYATFLWPLDKLRHWNRLYGRRGFVQFQCVLPHDAARDGLRALLEAAAGRASPLAVLKRMGEGRAGMLSFPRPGCTLALDFPRMPGIETLHARLVAITLDHGGRTYLAKDSLLDPEAFRRMYPELPDFRAVLRAIDPEARFASDMARRLRLREDTP